MPTVKYANLRVGNEPKDLWRGFLLGIKEGKIDHFSDHAIGRYIEFIHVAILEEK